MENPTTRSTEHLPVSSGLATTSLACGILSVILGPLAGIAAIITGHMARGRIDKSHGALQGRGRATAGLILGYCLTVVSLFIMSALGNLAVNNAKRMTTVAKARMIESAVYNFLAEYDRMPSDGSSDTTVITSPTSELLVTLQGYEHRHNPKSIRFLAMKDDPQDKKSFIYSPAGTHLIGLYDPWHRGYRIRLDLDYDGRLEVNGEFLKQRRVAVWSDGPDQMEGTDDDVKTW